jgi:hypothetical protein
MRKVAGVHIMWDGTAFGEHVELLGRAENLLDENY